MGVYNISNEQYWYHHANMAVTNVNQNTTDKYPYYFSKKTLKIIRPPPYLKDYDLNNLFS